LITLANPLLVRFPSSVITASTIVKETNDYVILDDMTINLKNPTKSSSIKGNPLLCIEDLIRIPLSRTTRQRFLLDFSSKLLYRLGKSVEVVISVRKIKCITDTFLYCEGYSFPIRHDHTVDDQENSMSLFAKLGIWNKIPIFMEVLHSYPEKKPRPFKI